MKTFYVVAGFGLVLVFLIFYFIVAGLGGFSGEPSMADYGEDSVAGLIKQPIAFWTDFAFVLSGLGTLIWIDVTDETVIEAAPMRGASIYSIPLGVIMVWMGPGSMLEHALLLENWGWFDSASIHWYALFTIYYLVLRWIPRASSTVPGKILFYLVFIASCVGVGLWTWLDPATREPWSMILLGLLGGSCLVSLIPTLVRVASNQTNPCIQFETIGLFLVLLAAVLFGVAMIFLFTGVTGGRTEQWGHGAFHICAALTTFVIYLILRLEIPQRRLSQ